MQRHAAHCTYEACTHCAYVLVALWPDVVDLSDPTSCSETLSVLLPQSGCGTAMKGLAGQTRSAAVQMRKNDASADWVETTRRTVETVSATFKRISLYFCGPLSCQQLSGPSSICECFGRCIGVSPYFVTSGGDPCHHEECLDPPCRKVLCCARWTLHMIPKHILQSRLLVTGPWKGKQRCYAQ